MTKIWSFSLSYIPLNLNYHSQSIQNGYYTLLIIKAFGANPWLHVSIGAAIFAAVSVCAFPQFRAIQRLLKTDKNL